MAHAWKDILSEREVAASAGPSVRVPPTSVSRKSETLTEHAIYQGYIFLRSTSNDGPHGTSCTALFSSAGVPPLCSRNSRSHKRTRMFRVAACVTVVQNSISTIVVSPNEAAKYVVVYSFLLCVCVRICLSHPGDPLNNIPFRICQTRTNLSEEILDHQHFRAAALSPRQHGSTPSPRPAPRSSCNRFDSRVCACFIRLANN